ncbi:unnamed protein product [Peniophora sp. CBMAI 1063]|nr:unnamed protein product [Peniophora sp. CBMAI 1063]
MGDLPTELLSAIVKDLPARDLRQLRATDRRLKEVTEQGAFRQITITNTVKSIGGLVQLLNSDRLREFVEVIDFKERPRPAELGELRYIPPDPVASTEADEGLYQAIQTALAQFHRFPRLNTLRLIFRKVYDIPLFQEDGYQPLNEPPPSASIDLQRALIAGLGAFGENCGNMPVHHLAVQNLLPYAHEAFAHPGLARLLSSLHVLEIGINDASEEVGAYGAANLPVFYEHSLPRILRAGQELRELTLAPRAIYIGIEFSLNFSGLTIPHLEKVSLARVSFKETDPTGPEHFIIRHAGALRSLELIYCTIHKYEDELVIDRPWAATWNLFAEELKLLTKLRVEWEGSSGEHTQLGYCSEEPGVSWGPSNHYPIDGVEGDAAALDAFAEIVKARDGGEVTILATIPDRDSDVDEDEDENEGEDGEDGESDEEEEDSE